MVSARGGQIFTIARHLPVRGVERPSRCHTQFGRGRAAFEASSGPRGVTQKRLRGVTLSSAVSHKNGFEASRMDGWARHGPSAARRPPTAMPAPAGGVNRIKASLSAFQRRDVKVLGFGVKARPRPQRMALRWCYGQFGLVGANGKACGEVSGVLFSGAPPWGVGVCFVGNRSHDTPI